MAVTVGLFAATLGSAHAQGPLTAYGIGQDSGSTVTARMGGVTCGDATVDAGGNWLLPIDSSAACAPVDGDTINFYLDGVAVTETATWTEGGSPATSGYDADLGISLTAGAASGGGADAPGAADTGNGGFAVAGSTTSAGLWLALMALAGLTLVGSRVATRSR